MAGKTVSKQSIAMGLSTAGAVAGYARLGSVADTFRGKASAGLATVNRGFGGLAKQALKLTSIVGLVGSALGGLGAGLAVKGQLEAVDASAKAADRLGTSIGAYEGLSMAAAMAGSSQEGLTKSMGRLSRTMGDGTAAKGLKMLGLQMADMRKLSPEDQLASIADAVAGMENPATRAAAAYELFGRQGEELTNLLMSGGGAIRQAIEDADRFGLSVSRVDAGQVEAANDAVSSMGYAFQGLARIAAVVIAPVIKTLADGMTGALVTLRPRIGQLTEWFKGTGVAIADTFARWLPLVFGILDQTLVGVGSAWSWVTSTFSANLDWLTTYWSNAWTALGIIASTVWDGIVNVVRIGTQFLSDAFHWASGRNVEDVSAAEYSIVGSFQKIGSWVSWLSDKVLVGVATISYGLRNWSNATGLVGMKVLLWFTKIGNYIHHVAVDVVWPILKWMVGNVGNLFVSLYNLSTQVFSQLADNVVNIFSNLPDLIAGTMDWSDVWKPLTEGFRHTMTDLPELAAQVPGAFEVQLETDINALAAQNEQGLKDYIDEVRKSAIQTKGVIDGALEKPNIFNGGGDTIKPPAATPTPFGDLEWEAPAAKSKGTHSGHNIFANSAEAQQLAYAQSPLTRMAAEAEAKAAGAKPSASHGGEAKESLNDLTSQLVATAKSMDKHLKAINDKTPSSTESWEL